MRPLILVVDLEATCSDDGTIGADEMETIEIGACWVSADEEILGQFQCFVRPTVNPMLTPFCEALTGISQVDVDNADVFPVAAAALKDFVEKFSSPDAIWMSWGMYDRKQITRESLVHQVEDPLALPHQNAKKLFAKNQKIGKEVGMARACLLARLALQGAHHRALDDAKNIARLLPWVTGANRLGT